MLDSKNQFFTINNPSDKTSFLTNPILDYLYNVDDKKLVQGQYDKVIEKYISEAEIVKNRENLKQLSFVLFSGSRVNRYPINNELLSKQRILILLLNNNSSNISDIIFMLLDCYVLWKEVKKESSFERPQQSPNLSSLMSISDTLENINAEDEILITHGGGYFHILAFLQGKISGYRLEGNCGLGLQVHASEHGKTLHYSNTIGWLHLDDPAFLMARIKAKYLCSQNRNGYEAGLRSEWISKLTNIQVVRMPHIWLGNGLEHIINKNSELYQPNLEKYKNIILQFFEAKKTSESQQVQLWESHFSYPNSHNLRPIKF